ncbi:MAG: RluA family pseudouridine synthase [Hydrogenophaga sp.]|uniref:RluA family pseudouridine synthase n=1 Tax=Hydrogenophaga sp. TaxID=1904254 RepID=UPI00263A144A|nr:RluA family pseudouridine synthase [Hydrogenophaga sp.]MDM7943780.1 RluA family pseudouridine synthase [Hydrogenophaga sp.]
MKAQSISTGGGSPGLAADTVLDAASSADEWALEVEKRVCDVPAAMHGWRIDRALAQLIPEFSRSYLQQLMADGAVEVRGEARCKPSARIAAGDRLQVELRPTQQAQAFVPEAMELDVVFEDADLLVIHKPAGLVVHPAAGNWSGTLLNGLLHHHAGAASLPRAGIVHRLDKDTSGLMLVGKTRQAVEALVRAIAAREVSRQYLALAHGRWKGQADQHVDQPIGRDVHNRLRMAVVRVEGGSSKTAQTTVRLLDSCDQASLLACKLHTGRTHQIRVHMAWLGHPLVGDSLYGGRALWGMTRQSLHAARLELKHPISGRPLLFRSTPPADMLLALQSGGLHYNVESWDVEPVN